MKKLFSILASCAMMAFVSCDSDEIVPSVPEDVNIKLSFAIEDSPYGFGSMARATTIEEANTIFATVFKPQIENGTLLGDSVHLTFEPINSDGTSCSVRTNKHKSITLKTGTYKVTGTIGIDDENIGAKGALFISDQVQIESSTTDIKLKGSFDRQALVFADTNFTYTYHTAYDPIKSSKFDSYNYMFITSNYSNYLVIAGQRYETRFSPNKYYFFKTKEHNSISAVVEMENGFE